MTRTLAFDNVSKTFGDVRVLDSVSVSLPQGRICCLLGHNGSGKSTLIKVLSGFYTADPGAVVREGDESAPLTDDASARWRDRIRFIHQDLGLVDDLGAIDNMALGRGFLKGRFGRILWRAERARAEKHFARLGVRIDLDVPVRRLSAVERTVVAVVRALLDIDETNGVLVLDEPTASLSAPEAEDLYRIVRQLVAGGVAVLLVTHHLNEVTELADHVVVLRDGRVVADRSAEGVTHQQLVEYITGETAAQIAETVSQELPPSEAPVALRARAVRGKVLDGFDLELRAGEIVGVAGLNGSGRDEIASLVFGVEEPTGGQVEVVGSRTAPTSPRAAARAGIAMVPADRARTGIVARHAVRENITLTRLRAVTRGGRISRRRERADALRWMASVDLPASFLEYPIEALSGGSQQKAIIARWISREPAILVLDEPTQGVDVAAKRSIHRLVQEAAQRGTAVLVCSSDNEELAELASRVLVLQNGRVVDELRGSRLTDTSLTEAMLNTEGH